MAQVPVIDLKKLSGEERQSVMAVIHRACADWGFFHVVNHGVSQAVLDKVSKLFKEYYANTMDDQFQKSEVAVALTKAMENETKLENADWEAGFFLTHSNHNTNLDAPQLPLPLKEAMEEFSEEVKVLAERLLEIMSENLGLHKKYLEDAMGGKEKRAFFGTKMCHYPPCPRPDLVEGLRAHTDAGGLILLLQDDVVGGLQMFREEDGLWYDVKPLANALVIDIGDQIEVMSNGEYVSRWHRVQSGINGNRMSVASFYNPAPDALISPAPSVLSKSKSGKTYPTFVSSDYMKVYAPQKFQAKEPRFEAVTAPPPVSPAAF